MIEPASKRPAPVSSNLALRVAVIGFVGFALFGVLFLRLWFLQVLSGDQYVAQATQNRVRIEPVQAPRGDIVDRNDDVLVQNRQATVLRLKPSTLPDDVRQDAVDWGNAVEARNKRPKGHQGRPVAYPAVRREVLPRFARLSRIAGVAVGTIQQRVMIGLYQVPYAQIAIRTDVRDDVRTYIQERPDEFPGVTVDQVYLREYPHGSLAAQLMGTTSEISPKQLDTTKFKGVKQGTVVGQSGLEYEYDRYLRGTDGRLITNVDAQGLARDDATRTRPSTPGQQVKLSLDLGLQETGQKALSRFGKPGAFVAMDPETGEVYAMGSAPTFDANALAKPMSDSQYKRRFGEAAGAPLFNRAMQAGYPVGSTFKPITSFAALATGTITPSTVIGDSTGCLTIGAAGQQVCNAGKAVLGPQTVVGALKVSSDVFFYKMGLDIYQAHGQALQQWARRLGLGHKTGIDLPAEEDGNVPDRAWRAALNRAEPACRAKQGGTPCYVDDYRHQYSLGDNVNLAVGQGDFLATPLQMVTAYSAIANGGRLVKPHLGESVEDSQGRLVQELSHGAAREVSLPGSDLDAIRSGLHEAASAAGGTSASVFAKWPQGQLPVYGKTGTAQTGQGEGSGDQSWYVAYVPKTAGNSRPLVVAATIEKGGFGAAAAAPTVCRILAKWYDRPNVPCTPGTNTDL